jgi:hypothetical protein
MYGDIGASRAMVRGIAETGIAGMQEAMALLVTEWVMGHGLSTTSLTHWLSTSREGVEPFDPTRYVRITRLAEFTPFGEFEQFQFRGPAEFREFEFRPDYPVPAVRSISEPEQVHWWHRFKTTCRRTCSLWSSNSSVRHS